MLSTLNAQKPEATDLRGDLPQSPHPQAPHLQTTIKLGTRFAVEASAVRWYVSGIGVAPGYLQRGSYYLRSMLGS